MGHLITYILLAVTSLVKYLHCVWYGLWCDHELIALVKQWTFWPTLSLLISQWNMFAIVTNILTQTISQVGCV